MNLKETTKFLSICEENDTKKVINFYNNSKNLDLSYNNNEAFRIFCLKNNFDLIKWSLGVKKDMDIFCSDNFCLYQACKNGNFKIFTWLYLKYCNFETFQYPHLILKKSFEGKNLKLIKYIYFVYSDKFIKKESILELACKNGNHNIIEFFFDEIDLKNSKKLINCLKYLIENQNIDILIKFISKYKHIVKNFLKEDRLTLISTMAEVDNIEILKCLLNNNILDLEMFNEDIIFDMIINDNISCVNFIIEINKDLLQKVKSNRGHMESLSRHILSDFGVYIDTLKFALENFDEIDSMVKESLVFFNKVCELEELDVVKYLISKYPDIFYAEIVDDKIINWYTKKKLELNSEKKVNDIENCPICLDAKSNIISSCNHQFCYDCINKIYSKKALIKCPLCRNNVFNFDKLI